MVEKEKDIVGLRRELAKMRSAYSKACDEIERLRAEINEARQFLEAGNGFEAWSALDGDETWRSKPVSLGQKRGEKLYEGENYYTKEPCIESD